MNISRLPSGSYRIRKMIDGKSYTITLSYKPTKKEAEQLIADKLRENQTGSKAGKSFFDCAYDYIEIKRNILSPTTIKAYKSLLDNAFDDDFLKKDIESITMADIQKTINLYSANHAPKTVYNLNGFISSIFAIYRPSMQICTTLPQKAKNEPYIPSEDDVKRIFEYTKGSKWEVALKLCAMGLRRSEVCALTIDDLDDDNVLTIDKALVLDEFNHFIVKATKTTDSTRRIIIPQDLADLIRKQGFVFNESPNSIYKHLKRCQKALGIPTFSPHKLRHFFVSYSHSMGIPDVYIQQMGGYKGTETMKKVYTHAMNQKSIKMQNKYSNAMSKLYS